jgi:hypothetical protein
MHDLLSDRERAVWSIADDLVDDGKHAVEHDDPAIMDMFFEHVRTRFDAVPPSYRPSWEYMFQDLYLHASLIGSRHAEAWLKAAHDRHFDEATRAFLTGTMKYADRMRGTGRNLRWRVRERGPWTLPIRRGAGASAGSHKRSQAGGVLVDGNSKRSRDEPHATPRPL